MTVSYFCCRASSSPLLLPTCPGAEALRVAHVDMLSSVEASHAADGETAAAIGAAAEQGAQAMGGQLLDLLITFLSDCRWSRLLQTLRVTRERPLHSLPSTQPDCSFCSAMPSALRLLRTAC